MNPIHRKRINKFCDILVNNINIVTIWPFLIRNKIFNRDDHGHKSLTHNLLAYSESV